MAKFYYHPQNPDSINITGHADTIHPAAGQRVPDSVFTTDTIIPYAPPEFPFKSMHLPAVNAPSETKIQLTPLVRVVSRKTEPLTDWNSSRNFFLENGLTGIVSGNTQSAGPGLSTIRTGMLKPSNINPQVRHIGAYDWILGIFIFLTLLFIWIRVFYSKFFALLGNALLSFQISAKLFREKNVLVQRVSLVLDFIYILVISLFLFELIMQYGPIRPATGPFNIFLILLNVLIFYTLFRLFVLRVTGYLFMAKPLFAEYLHNTLVVNKGVGIALFPVVIMAQYLPYMVVPVILTFGIVIFIVAFILKSIRAYQIIIRKDVILFYLILYLCTLEILPLLLGYKFVTSLI